MKFKSCLIYNIKCDPLEFSLFAKFFITKDTKHARTRRLGEAAAGAGARCPLGWSPSPGVTLTALCDTCPASTAPGQSAAAGSAGGWPRPGSGAAAGSAAAFFHTPPGRRSHPVSSPPPRLLLTWVRDEGFSGRSRRDRGPRADEREGTADWSPGARVSQGPAARPSRLTQIAEAPGEEPLAARGSRLLPPALLSLGLPACFSRPAES